MEKMNLSKLCCPICKAKLLPSDIKITCTGCSREYIIESDVLIFIDEDGLDQHHRNQINYFSNEAVIYEKNYILRPWQKKYISIFDEMLETRPDSNLVADVGAGSGYMTIELAKKGFEVLASDLSLPSMIRLSRLAKAENVDHKITFICCKSEALPIADKTVDFVVSNAVLEHIPNEISSIKEFDRISKSSTKMLLAVPISYKFLHPLLVPINWIHDKRIGHLRRYDEDIIKEKFLKWDVSKVYYTGHVKKVIKTIMNILKFNFNEDLMEEEDWSMRYKRNGSSNIVVIMGKTNS